MKNWEIEDVNRYLAKITNTKYVEIGDNTVDE